MVAFLVVLLFSGSMQLSGRASCVRLDELDLSCGESAIQGKSKRPGPGRDVGHRGHLVACCLKTFQGTEAHGFLAPTFLDRSFLASLTRLNERIFFNQPDSLGKSHATSVKSPRTPALDFYDYLSCQAYDRRDRFLRQQLPQRPGSDSCEIWLSELGSRVALATVSILHVYGSAPKCLHVCGWFSAGHLMSLPEKS